MYREKTVAYDYRGAYRCASCTLKALIIDGAAEPEFWGMDPDEALDLVELTWEVIFGDESTYGLLDFPSRVEGDVTTCKGCGVGSSCENCGVRLA